MLTSCFHVNSHVSAQKKIPLFGVLSHNEIRCLCNSKQTRRTAVSVKKSRTDYPCACIIVSAYATNVVYIDIYYIYVLLMTVLVCVICMSVGIYPCFFLYVCVCMLVSKVVLFLIRLD